MSSPIRRILAPAWTSRGMRTWSPLTWQTSCITTVSAPGGMGAPVKIRAAVPGSRWVPVVPAGMRWLTRSRPP